MAHKATEFFAQFIYSLDLSYHSLLEREGELKTGFTAILEQYGGEFIHFEEIGDTMRAQCVFDEYEEELFHNICDELAPWMDAFVEARLLFVNKDLSFLHIYTVSDGNWQESCLKLPEAGPLERAVREERR
ncbi:MAG: hypothetical protein LBD42_08265 [Desulfovibrio sp.]|jgi:hypothetical protein|nr:hypothetical protein [Desulfovibrio sp.]